MDTLQALTLGLVQGITEWLPISSSGHLAITHKLLNIAPSAAFDVTLHFGTLLAVAVIYWSDFWEMIKAAIRLDTKSPSGKMAVNLIIATIPAAVLGYLFSDFFEGLFSNLLAIGIALIITGAFLFLASMAKGRNEVGRKEALIIGIAQAASIIPGISRSGATMSAGMLSGVDKNKAVQFSFLISFPITLGASVYELKKSGLLELDPLPMVSGVIAAFIAGYLSIKLLINLVRQSKLQYFAYYCIIAGLLVIAFLSG
jgi:undecaprenyl-diphosphatase